MSAKTMKPRRQVPYWWLSFAEDSGFRGVVIIRARDQIEGIKIAWRLGINPGGQVVGFELPPEQQREVPQEAVGRLLQRPDIEALFPQWHCKSLKEHKQEEIREAPPKRRRKI